MIYTIGLQIFDDNICYQFFESFPIHSSLLISVSSKYHLFKYFSFFKYLIAKLVDARIDDIIYSSGSWQILELLNAFIGLILSLPPVQI